MKDKTDARAPIAPERSLPFFARFLEGQDTPEVCGMTLKYPSDRDEDDVQIEYTASNSQN